MLKIFIVLGFSLVPFLLLFSAVDAEDVQGTLVRRTAGKDFTLPYTELILCPTVQPAGRCLSIYTDPNGRFYANLRPGRYSVGVSYRGKQTYGGQIEVVKGRGTYPRIVIAP
jgi:hypothetical protein